MHAELGEVSESEHIEKIFGTIESLDFMGSEYRIVGSAGIMGAIGGVHRLPSDIDAIANIRYKDEIASELNTKGFTSLDFTHNVFTNMKFWKSPDGVDVDIHFFDFNPDGSMRCPVNSRIAGLPIQNYLDLSFVYTPSMTPALRRTVRGHTFNGLSREAHWVQLDKVLPLMNGKRVKRLHDYYALGQHVDL